MFETAESLCRIKSICSCWTTCLLMKSVLKNALDVSFEWALSNSKLDMHFLPIRGGILENFLFFCSKILLGRIVKERGVNNIVLGSEMVIVRLCFRDEKTGSILFSLNSSRDTGNVWISFQNDQICSSCIKSGFLWGKVSSQCAFYFFISVNIRLIILSITEYYLYPIFIWKANTKMDTKAYRDLLALGSLPKCQQQSGLGQVEVRFQDWVDVSFLGGHQRSKYSSQVCCIRDVC